MKDNILYHLTSVDNLPSILRNGIVPSIGDNSRDCNELRPLIYLCDYDSIPYWSILLGHKTVLTLNVSDLNLQTYYYRGRNYSYVESISDSSIGEYKIEDITKCTFEYGLYNKRLCLSYLSNLSELVSNIVHCYDYHRPNGFIVNAVAALLKVLDRLDYSKVNTDELCYELLLLNDDVGYPFTDVYRGSDIRMWEALVRFERNDPTFTSREKLYNFIKENLSCVAYTKTGEYIV